MDTALEITDRFECKQASVSLTALMERKSSAKSHFDLYQQLMKIVVDGMANHLSIKEINYLVRGSTNLFIHFNVRYYCEDLISNAIEVMITKNANIEEIGKILRNLDRCVSYNLSYFSMLPIIPQFSKFPHNFL